MNNDYIRDCVNVMMTSLTVVVVVTCLFICYTLALWAVNMMRNLVRDQPAPELGDEMFAHLQPQPPSSANGSGMRRTRFPSDES